MEGLSDRDFWKLVEYLEWYKDERMFEANVFELKCKATDEQIVKAYEEAGLEQDLMDIEIDRQDEFDNALMDFIYQVTGEQPAYGDRIGNIREAVLSALEDNTDHGEYFFYPYMVSTD